MDNINIAQLSCNEATSKYLVSDLAKDIITGSTALTKAKLLFETNRKIAIESAAAKVPGPQQVGLFDGEGN